MSSKFNKNEALAFQKGYRCSEDGIVSSCFNSKIGYIYRSSLMKYHCFDIKVNGKVLRIKTHRFQMYQKYGEKIYEKGLVVRHLNGNSLDNRLANLEIGTDSDNMMDKPKELRLEMGQYAASFNIKYTNDQIEKLKIDKMNGMGYTKLSKKFGIPRSSVRDLLKRSGF